MIYVCVKPRWSWHTNMYILARPSPYMHWVMCLSHQYNYCFLWSGLLSNSVDFQSCSIALASSPGLRPDFILQPWRKIDFSPRLRDKIWAEAWERGYNCPSVLWPQIVKMYIQTSSINKISRKYKCHDMNPWNQALPYPLQVTKTADICTHAVMVESTLLVTNIPIPSNMEAIKYQYITYSPSNGTLCCLPK